MLHVHIPSPGLAEARWICAVLLGEFFGLEYKIIQSRGSVYRLEMDSRCLEFPDLFLAQTQGAWLKPQSLIAPPLMSWDVLAADLNVPLVQQPLPVLLGQPELAITPERIHLGVDIFGTAFYLLSCYEEAVITERDVHDRFPSKASLAYRVGFLDRPLVDEYVEVLWAAMKRLWPSLQRKPRHASNHITSDVDAPYQCATKGVVRLARQAAGDILKRRSPRAAVNTFRSGWHAHRGDYTQDRNYRAFDWMMDVNEAAGNQVAFYFIAGHSNPKMDGCYDLDEPIIRELMRRIHSRGHEIGLHGSYDTYRDGNQIAYEAANLIRVLEEEGIQQQTIGCRQHFLRWCAKETPRHLDAAGFDYDTTLSYADRPGFRCGTCHEFSMYDVTTRRPLNIRQRPLIVMECSVIADRYLGLGRSDDALALMLYYKDTCHRFGGTFTLLWHNSHFTTEADRQFYRELIA